MIKTKKQDDYDSPWKMAVSLYFEHLIAFFFPEIHSHIDWSKPYEFLDKELKQVMRDDKIGGREADKLIKVWLIDGSETWILLHLEIQSQYQINFAERMYVYNSRIFGIYGKKVVSLAILADDEPSWRPTAYNYEILGCQVLLKFPMVKLLDYEQNWSQLEQSLNPFAIIVMAHLKTQATRKHPKQRLTWKLSIFKSLYQRGYNSNDIRELFRVLDWMMKLPKNLDYNFEQEIESYQEEKKMGYVPSIVRAKVVDQRQHDIKRIVELRFKQEMPQDVWERLECFEDEEQLDLLLTQAITQFSMETFKSFMDALEPIQDW
jgi:hypothetical protein